MRNIVAYAILLSLILVFASCEMKKKYYYHDGNEEKVILAASDSAAYLEAYTNFQIAKKVHNDMKKAYSSTYSSDPEIFQLLNEKREDITYKVSFAKKDSLENDLSHRINEMPNGIEDAAKKAREKKNGIGAQYDTGGLYLAPIKVLNASFVTKEYSNYKSISLSYKNVSPKEVAAIRFKWYGENAFGEPADMGGIGNGWGGGFTDETLKSGAIENSHWDILSRDGKKILIAYPYEIAFTDGTKWKLEQ